MQLGHQQLQMLCFHGMFSDIRVIGERDLCDLLGNTMCKEYHHTAFLCRLNSRIGNPAMQAIQEENQIDDEHEENAIQQGILQQLCFSFPKKTLSSFNTDVVSLKNDENRSYSRSDDTRLPPLLESSRGRNSIFFNARI